MYICQYNYIVFSLSFQIDGTRTLGENIADNGGLRAAYNAYVQNKIMDDQELPGELEQFSLEQLFFISFGQLWCEDATPDYIIDQIQTGVHAPGELRVIGSVSNSEEFRVAFGCETGDPMVNDEQCVLW